jgi:hypothetical protein
MTIDVGTVLAVVALAGVKARLFVRLMVRLAVPVEPGATVITTGDQAVADGVAANAGFNEVQVAAVAAVPQKYPHMGTAEPSGNVAVAGAAVRLTEAWLV